MKKKKITIPDIKNALLDERFRKSLPEELSGDVDKFLSNPGCACNHPIYRKVAKVASLQLQNYFPQMELTDEKEVFDRVSKNNWQVINCHIYELSEELKKLGAGRKQIEVARYGEDVTVIINHLEDVY